MAVVIPYGIQSAFAGHVNDVPGTTGVARDGSETFRSFGLGYFGLREVMIQRGQVSLRPVFGDEEIDHIAVGCMNGNHATALLHLIHQAHHLFIIDHQRSLVSHEHLERSNAFFFDQVHDLFTGIIVEIGHGHVKAVIAHAIAIGPAAPFFIGLVKRMSLFLQDEIDHHRGAPVQGGPGAAFVIIAAEGAHERHFEVYMRVDESGEGIEAGSIDLFVCPDVEILTKRRDAFALDEDIAHIIVGSANDMGVFDEQGHDQSFSLLSKFTFRPL